MNIMFLIDTLGGGGAERVCLQIASAFAEDHQVCVVSIFDEPDADYYVDPKITVERLNLVIGKNIPAKIRSYNGAFRRIHVLAKQYRIDCCLSFLETANFFNGIIPHRGKRVISIRNYYPLSINNEKKTIRRIKAVIADLLADRIVTVSRAIQNEMTDNYKAPAQKTRTIYNFYDSRLETMTPDEKILGTFAEFRKREGVRFISIGRSSYQKGSWHLIRAFGKVRQTVPDARLLILGKGEMDPMLGKVIRANHLEDSILCPGFDPAVVHYLTLSDVFVSSSLYEGFSNALLEAMANGLPVIASDCFSGPREMLAPETDYTKQTGKIEFAEYGVLVPTCSENTDLTDEPLEKEELLLAEAMIRMAEDHELRAHYAEKSRERAADFTREKIVDQWKALINDLIN